MPRKTLLATCFLFSLLTTTRDAQAFWRWIRELSGPGPWVGFDAIFPWSLSFPKITSENEGRNLATLRRLGLDFRSIPKDASALATDEAYIRFLEDTFLLDLPDPVSPELSAEERDAAIRLFLVKLEKVQITKELARELDEVARVAFARAKADERAGYLRNARMTNNVRGAIRNFGAGPVGFFGSKQPMLQFKDDEPNRLEDFFLSVSLSAVTSLRNDIPYPPGVEADKYILWVSAYTAFEWRFKNFNPNANLFVNVGPSFNYVIGDGFDEFFRLGIKTQLGVRIHPLHVGIEVEGFFPGLGPEDFGAVPGAFETERVRVGGFLGFELVKPR